MIVTNIDLARYDWDSLETSWDFRAHPLVRWMRIVRESFDAWEAECKERFRTIKANEEELNRIFIDIYAFRFLFFVPGFIPNR